MTLAIQSQTDATFRLRLAEGLETSTPRTVEVWGPEFGVRRLGFGVWSLEFGVWSSGFWVARHGMTRAVVLANGETNPVSNTGFGQSRISARDEEGFFP